jgi:hypothetical protein
VVLAKRRKSKATKPRTDKWDWQSQFPGLFGYAK